MRCPQLEIKTVDGEERELCRISLMAFKKMQPCVGGMCTFTPEEIFDDDDEEQQQ